MSACRNATKAEEPVLTHGSYSAHCLFFPVRNPSAVVVLLWSFEIGSEHEEQGTREAQTTNE